MKLKIREANDKGLPVCEPTKKTGLVLRPCIAVISQNEWE
jgi:hypothetical protein